MKVSVLYGKKVESTAGKRGYVVCVNAADKKIKSFTCADDDEKLFYIDVKNVKSIKDKIIFENAALAAEGEPLRLGRPVFDCNGAYLGKLTDITADKYGFTVIHAGTKKFSADDVVCGDAVIIKSSARVLKSDVKKNGKTLIRRGTPLTPDVALKAQKHGEYVQANLKTI